MLGECSELVVYTKGMLRPNNNQLYSYYVSLLLPTEYLQYLWILLTIKFIFPKRPCLVEVVFKIQRSSRAN